MKTTTIQLISVITAIYLISYAFNTAAEALGGISAQPQPTIQAELLGYN